MTVTAAELHELREAWIRAPRGCRSTRERAFRAAVAQALREKTQALREQTAPAAPDQTPEPPAAPSLQPEDDSAKLYWQKDQYA